jgi:hypothetical protein
MDIMSRGFSHLQHFEYDGADPGRRREKRGKLDVDSPFWEGVFLIPRVRFVAMRVRKRHGPDQ